MPRLIMSPGMINQTSRGITFMAAKSKAVKTAEALLEKGDLKFFFSSRRRHTILQPCPRRVRRSIHRGDAGSQKTFPHAFVQICRRLTTHKESRTEERRLKGEM